MSRPFVLIVFVAELVAAVAAAGCSAGSGNNSGNIQGSHMYIGQETLGNVLIYQTPVTPVSTPVGTLTGLAFANELYVDKSGRLFVPLGPQGGKQVQVFTPPIIGGNSPAYTLTTIGVFPESTAEDAAGNIYVGISNGLNIGCCIDIFNGPVTGAATAGSEIMKNGVNFGLDSPSGMAFDVAGNLYVSSFQSILKYTPPISAASTPSANVMPNNDDIGLAVDLTNVYVANATTDGTIDVFPLPLSVAVRSYGILVTATTNLNGLAIDGSGNLWAVDANGGIWEIAAPITAASTPTKILTVAGGAYGITFGP